MTERSRARALTGFDVRAVAEIETDDGLTSVWSIEAEAAPDQVGEDEDVALYAQGWIVVTPMKVDEHDPARLDGSGWAAGLPPWAGG